MTTWPFNEPIPTEPWDLLETGMPRPGADVVEGEFAADSEAHVTASGARDSDGETAVVAETTVAAEGARSSAGEADVATPTTVTFEGNRPPVLVGGVVAVGVFGEVLSSPDGVEWTEQSSGTTSHLRGAAWSDDLDVWVAVGDDGTVLTSEDAASWTSQTYPHSGHVNDVVWSDDLDVWVAVGDDGEVATSSDGETWTSQTYGSTDDIEAITWSPTESVFVAVGGPHSGGGKIKTSPDGETWTERTSPYSSGTLFAATWSPDESLFSIGGLYDRLATSPDGVTWTARTLPHSGTTYAVAWSPTESVFVEGGGHTTARVSTSPDGVTWTARSYPHSGTIRSIVWSPDVSMFVAGGADGELATSPDGVTWTARSTPITSQILAVATGNVPGAAVEGEFGVAAEAHVGASGARDSDGEAVAATTTTVVFAGEAVVPEGQEWVFITPTFTARHDPDKAHPRHPNPEVRGVGKWFGHTPVGMTVLRNGDEFTTVIAPTRSQIDNADEVWRGGRRHVVDGTTASDLVAAGYDVVLEDV